MSKIDTFKPEKSTWDDINKVCAQLLHVDGDVHNNIKKFKIDDLLK